MNPKEPLGTERRYFAAANGYQGFRSYFDSIFNIKRFDRIFILKGGPGTGKSTLMKKVARAFPDGVFRTEVFHCSSDPSSLDGVAVRSQKGSIAVLDGTAPHERDATAPGAIDEIVDLADALQKEPLRRARGAILALAEEKRAHYRNAYRFLKEYGEFSENSEAECDRVRLRSLLFSLIPEAREEEEASSVRLIRAFGREGETVLPTFSRLAGVSYLLTGNAGAHRLFFRELLHLCARRGITATVSPSPYDGDMLDAVLLPSRSVAFLAVGEEGVPLELASLFRMAEIAESASPHLLFSAQQSFAEASRAHFALERIYGEALDPSVLEKKTEYILNTARAVLV